MKGPTKKDDAREVAVDSKNQGRRMLAPGNLIPMIRRLKIITLIAGTLLTSMAHASQSEDMTEDLRKTVFDLNPAEIGISRENFKHPVWGMVMETGFEDGSFSLVTLADGTASLYFSTGGGVIGAGEHESVRKAAGHYLSGAQYFFEQATPVESTPRPVPGKVIFYFLGFEGISAYEAPEQKLGIGEDELSNLFYAAHEVINEIRKVEEN